MTAGGSPPGVAPGPTERATALLLVLLPLLAAVAPPETRAEGAILCAVVGIVALGLHVRSASASRAAGIVLPLALAAGPLALVAGQWVGVVGRLAPLVAAVGVAVAVGSVPRTPELRRLVPWALLAAGTIPAIHGLWQVAFGLDRSVDALDPAWLAVRGGEYATRLDAGRAFAAFPTPAALGGWIALFLPAAAILARSASGGARWFAGTLVAIQAAGLLATRSVTAAFALAAAAVVVTVVRGGSRRIALALLALAVAAAGFAAASRWDDWTAEGGPGNPLDLRLRNARAAVAMTADRPWSGVGLGGFADAYPSYRRPGDNETRYAHDLPLQAVAELGLPIGVPAAAAFLWLFAGPMLRARSRTDPLEVGLAVGLGAFAIHNLLDFTAFLPSFALAVAVLRGWIARPEPGGGPTARDGAPSRLVAGASAAAVVVAGFLWIAAEGYARDARFRAAWLSLEGEVALARTVAVGAHGRVPWDADLALRAAELLAIGEDGAAAGPEDLARALEVADRAVAARPANVSARGLRAVLRERVGDVPGAWADAAYVAERYPASDDARARRDRLRTRIDGRVSR